MKTEEIGLDYMLPVWVARSFALFATVVVVAIGYLVFRVLLVKPPHWLDTLLQLIALCGPFLAIIYRALTVIPRLRDDRFQANLRKFKALKNTSWGAVLDRLVADPEIMILYEVQNRVNVCTGDLLVELSEAEGRVRGVRFSLIVED